MRRLKAGIWAGHQYNYSLYSVLVMRVVGGSELGAMLLRSGFFEPPRRGERQEEGVGKCGVVHYGHGELGDLAVGRGRPCLRAVWAPFVDPFGDLC